ncbi:hypothetical protein EG328_008486 [Venturia inaequalis]|uniref:Uncharacterized protein n=1 Tax=Venturia inaequalis TaxID=5025 RepID=A0A8H3YP97_VENIN|nr:hypothetical protein EG328_008486 [Venturia inaequalis]
MAPVGFLESKHIFVTPLSPAKQSEREIASKAQEAEAKTLEDAMRKHVTSEAATPKQDPPALSNRQKKAAERQAKKEKAEGKTRDYESSSGYSHGSYDKPGVN